MLKPLLSRWDGPLAQIAAVKHKVDLESPTIRLIISTPYHAGPETSEFESYKIENRLVMNMMEAAQTEWTSSAFPARV